MQIWSFQSMGNTISGVPHYQEDKAFLNNLICALPTLLPSSFTTPQVLTAVFQRCHATALPSSSLTYALTSYSCLLKLDLVGPSFGLPEHFCKSFQHLFRHAEFCLRSHYVFLTLMWIPWRSLFVGLQGPEQVWYMMDSYPSSGISWKKGLSV